MVIKGLREDPSQIWIRYNTTWNMTWDQVLDIMQVFLSDIKENVHGAEYKNAANGYPTPIKTINEGLLYRTEELKKERYAVSLSGISKTYNTPITLMAYNHSQTIDITIPKTEDNYRLLYSCCNDEHFLDAYMNSLEMHGYERYYQREAINLYGKFMGAMKGNSSSEIINEFRELCIDLGATPFPKK